MPLDLFRARMAAVGGYEGEARRRNSQNIMDASWMRDPATKPVYVKWVDSGLPLIDDDDVPVYAKYNVKSYHNITGDEVAYLLQFRLEDIRDNPNIKVGSYVQIRNEMDEPEWWLIWHLDDRTQFRQFSIVKCTWIYKWTSFKDGHRVIHQCLGVTRNQNNYNSGCWLDYVFEIVEQQHVMERTVGTRAAGCGVGATTSCLRRANGQPRLTCGLCAPGPPSASVPPEQLLPGPSPVKMESSSGPLRFCSRALMRPFFLKMSLTRLTPSTSLYSSAIPFSFKVNFYWSRVALQCCVSFCWTAKQISFKVLKW